MGQDPLAVSGHRYPEGAVMVAAEAYWWHLDRLRLATSRAQAADRAQRLAQAAGKVAATLTGHPEGAPDTHADPLAWTDISTLVGGLAIALGGVRIDHGSYPDALDGPYDGWGDMAGATTRREFAAAWYPFAQEFRQRAGIDGTTAQDDGTRDDDVPALRAFAVAQVTRAAAAIVDAAW
jgi:PHD/YefM family antitoxin component YafN of YafNO toxin-antitoxin module